MAGLLLRGIKKTYGTVKVLHGIDLDIKSGEFIVFVGPSGCGKSTLLRLIAGLEDITAGTLQIDGEVVNQLAPSKRGIAMVFQSYALYPHMTVYDNMAFGMKLAKGHSQDEIDKRVRQAADVLQITPYLDRLPKQLSGGQRQRVAIGRAIVRDPKVFLFDEPLSNLDAALRVQTRIEINKLHESMPGVTMIYVTHDQVEAMTLADRIVVLNAGRVEQVGAPMELYHNPDNLFVARFLGSPSMNTIPCVIESGGSDPRVKPDGCASIPVKATIPASAAGTKGTFGVRPEDLEITTGDFSIFRGTVDIVEQLGEVTLIYVDVGTTEPVVAKIANDIPVAKGDKVALTTELRHLHVFDEKGIAYPRT
ncbi:sn-glycerol-3-phosphate ABC transporter ATP-binding protein UgpC [Kaistia dalseonensis]|uniref:ABC-type sugar transport system ATPase subunit n=1 Tax=Kaistia dalseonensis TaxID=410840 RepID=A0ABU0H875_9HYPH|nr:sn-glycerol-3-phosphate ABC transporter ATP-binding protein UgpC [Kaistia dalseonensis]MCX5495908.1 sn-glycerol-3-phosphate ABC transporter ATP-binding protein UgpC [Kaistia dalseonensis]MDQ0438511.1 ABC-type sugar transport system ATPase subunit [Kaistia dalseonensis]